MYVKKVGDQVCFWDIFPDGWRTFLAPRMMSIIDFESTNRFVFKNTYTLMYFGGHSWLLRWKSGTPSGFSVMSLNILFIWKKIGVDSFILYLSCKILTILCITLFSIFKIEKDWFCIPQELLEDVPDSLDGDQELQVVPI